MTVQKYYYYDDYARISPYQGEQFVPSTRAYVNLKGNLGHLFINHNPWSLVGTERVYYQYCLFCRVKRFELEHPFNEQNSSVCCPSKKCENAWFEFMENHDTDTLRSILLQSQPTRCVLI